MTADAVKKMFRPILLSRLDMLTVGTAAQIEDNNNVFWCTFPETRPPDFPVKTCSLHTRRR